MTSKISPSEDEDLGLPGSSARPVYLDRRNPKLDP